MLTKFRTVAAKKPYRRHSTGSLGPATRRSSTWTKPQIEPLKLLPAPTPVPDFYLARTFNRNDATTQRLIDDNNSRRSLDLATFKTRFLTNPASSLLGARVHPLELAAMDHILGRHFPQYFAFNFKKQNTFFSKSTTLPHLIALIALVYRNGTVLRANGPFIQLIGKVNGVEYVLGLNTTGVGQFYPLSKASTVATATGHELRTELPDDGSVIHIPPSISDPKKE